MRSLLLAAAAIGGLTALATGAAVAAPSHAGLHGSPVHAFVTNVDYNYHHHHFHHRRWDHGHWRYWD